MLKQLNEVADFNPQTADNFFTKSYKKYLHLGAKFNDNPILVNLNDIIQIDEIFNNEGRETQHTTLEWQRLATDFGNGIKPWLDLPIVVKNTDKDIDKKYKLVAGYGSLNALKSNGADKYWFYEVVEYTPSILSEIAVFENTSEVITTSYKTGVDGIIFHLKNMIAKKHKALVNDEQSISDYIDKTWPGMIPEVKGVIISKARNAQTKSKRIKTYNLSEIDNWLQEMADQTAQFTHGGNFDSDRGMYGFVGVNIQDPFLRAAKKFAETGKKSYVVLHCKSPGKTQTIKDMRKIQLKKLQEFKSMFSGLGMKTNFLSVLGFLPQDTETDKMTLLVQ
jgi:hypothetical protein|tara:strand:+ start:184 stop:1188 length:1005 start_codon:yes stop_codon:yes gene_type:complete